MQAIPCASLYLSVVYLKKKTVSYYTSEFTRDHVFELQWLIIHNLRIVPNKYKGFFTRLGPCGKDRSLQQLLDSTKKHVFQIISL